MNETSISESTPPTVTLRRKELHLNITTHFPLPSKHKYDFVDHRTSAGRAEMFAHLTHREIHTQRKREGERDIVRDGERVRERE